MECQQRAAEGAATASLTEKDTIDRQLEAARKTAELKVAAERSSVLSASAPSESATRRGRLAAMREAVAAAEGRTGCAEDEVQAQQTALAPTVEQLQRRSAEVDELNEANRALASQIADLQLGATLNAIRDGEGGGAQLRRSSYKPSAADIRHRLATAAQVTAARWRGGLADAGGAAGGEPPTPSSRARAPGPTPPPSRARPRRRRAPRRR